MPQPKTEEQLRRKAMKYLESKTTEVSCFNAETEGNVPRFHPREIQTGDFLGAGGFCTVCEVSGVKLKSASSNEEEKKHENASVKSFGGKIVQDREFIASHIYRDDCARYAIKKLSPTLFRKPAGTFLSGVIDLAMEVKYLAVIQHPHIIKMRAVSSSHPCSDTFFIVLDRLYETLSERITSWKKDTKKFRGFGMAVRRLSGGAKVKNDQNTLLAERLLVAHDVCSALAYLHENSIVYRDIKPDNIGFDIRGDVKIFDFGLAKELSECHRVKNTDVFKLTKKCGSPRYMAPEVFNSKPYNHSVDVYAFGLMLWQICECKTPFEDYSYEKLEDEVMTRNMRPAINDKSTPAAVNNIIEKSWSHHMKTRPECRDILKQLKDQIVIQCGDQVLDGMDVSGRTEASIKAMQEG